MEEIDEPIKKISLTINERLTYRASLRLVDWGFEPIENSSFEFKNADFFKVMVGEWGVLFSSKTESISVQYDKVEKFLIKRGYKKVI